MARAILLVRRIGTGSRWRAAIAAERWQLLILDRLVFDNDLVLRHVVHRQQQRHCRATEAVPADAKVVAVELLAHLLQRERREQFIERRLAAVGAADRLPDLIFEV
jgi:hypothetical protein